MSKGYYNSRLNRTGNQLEVHFFDPQVLDKYKNSPYYVLSGGTISTNTNAPTNVRRVGLQQYVWGRKKDGSPCIAVLLSHIYGLDPKEQMYWRSFELCKKEGKHAKIEARYRKPMLEGRFPDTLPSFIVILPTLKFINQITSPFYLFRRIPASEPSFLQPITKNSKKEYKSYIQELDKLLSANINVGDLFNKVKSPKKNKMKENKETLNLLSLWLEELGIDKGGIENCLKPLKNVRSERQDPVHKIFDDDFGEDYISKQKEITLEVWKSLYQISQWLKSSLEVSNSIEEPRIISDFIII